MAAAVRHPNRRSDILEKAAPIFAQHGYEGTAIRNIAKACGITEAAIYRHFENKADLYNEVIRFKARQHDLRADLFDRIAGKNIEEILTAVALNILALADRDPELVRLMFSSSLEAEHATAILFQEVRSPYIEFLSGQIEKRIASGELRDVDPFITSRCFVGMVMDCALHSGVWSRLTGVDFVAENVVCNNVPIFARGLMRDVPCESA